MGVDVSITATGSFMAFSLLMTALNQGGTRLVGATTRQKKPRSLSGQASLVPIAALTSAAMRKKSRECTRNEDAVR
jgi:hypothetical protein